MSTLKLKNKFRVGDIVTLKSVKEMALEFAPEDYRPGESDEFYVELLHYKIPFGFNTEMARASGQLAVVTLINNSHDKRLNVSFINKEYRSSLSRWTYSEEMFKKSNPILETDSEEMTSEILTNFMIAEGTINEL